MTAIATTSPRLDRRAWATLLILCGAVFLDALDVSMVGVALPSIRADLGLSTASLQWIVSAYVLGYGGFLLLGGRAADLLGRRRLFIASLAVFVVASALGGLVTDGGLLIASRFIKGVSAAFTAPAGLSLITTSFSEGPARTRALSIYAATGASGWSLGLVFGGLLTELSWRATFFLPVPVALALVLAAPRFLPRDPARRTLRAREFDAAGAVTVTAAMLLFVYTVVSAPSAGWGSARTLLSFAGAAVLAGAFVATEQRTATPLVRLGILRSGALRRANLGAMAVIGGWFGVQFIATLYMQQLRGWSALTTALAFLPTGLIVAAGAPRAGTVIARFGLTRTIAASLLAFLAAYLLFLDIGAHSNYFVALLPTMLLAGIGFALGYGPLNVAATTGIADHEQGLASGLVTASFQVGGALVLAVATAVINATAAGSTSAPALLDGYRAGVIVSVVAAGLGLLVTVLGPLAERRRAPATACSAA